jgi:hypothetical protein
MFSPIRLEVFTATELDKISSGNKPCQLWMKAHLHVHHQGNYVDSILLLMEAEMVSETLDFYPQLTRLVVREDLIMFSSLSAKLRVLKVLKKCDCFYVGITVSRSN